MYVDLVEAVSDRDASAWNVSIGHFDTASRPDQEAVWFIIHANLQSLLFPNGPGEFDEQGVHELVDRAYDHAGALLPRIDRAACHTALRLLYGDEPLTIDTSVIVLSGLLLLGLQRSLGQPIPTREQADAQVASRSAMVKGTTQ